MLCREFIQYCFIRSPELVYISFEVLGVAYWRTFF